MEVTNYSERYLSWTVFNLLDNQILRTVSESHKKVIERKIRIIVLFACHNEGVVLLICGLWHLCDKVIVSQLCSQRGSEMPILLDEIVTYSTSFNFEM